tara:strand:- start:2144 stop:2254 length:111 start_codon:yes stop_codon:yes gene_type:complete
MELVGRVLHIVAIVATAWFFIASYSAWNKIQGEKND